MTDAEYEAQRARIVALAERWTRPLGLGWWTITHEYERDSGRFESDTDASSASVLASCKADWRYLKATITWNMRHLQDTSDDYLEKAFVHELMHVMLHELSVDDSHHNASEERVASTLANAFVWVRAEGNGEGMVKR